MGPSHTLLRIITCQGHHHHHLHFQSNALNLNIKDQWISDYNLISRVSFLLFLEVIVEGNWACSMNRTTLGLQNLTT